MLGSRALRRAEAVTGGVAAPFDRGLRYFAAGATRSGDAPRSAARGLPDDLFSCAETMLNFAEGNDVDIDPLGEFAANVPTAAARGRPAARGLPPLPAHGAPPHPQARGQDRPPLRRQPPRQRTRGADTAPAVGGGHLYKINDLLRPLDPRRGPGGPPELVFLGRLNLPHNDDGVPLVLRTRWAESSSACPASPCGSSAEAPPHALRALSPGIPAAFGWRASSRTSNRCSPGPCVAGAAPLCSGIKTKISSALARGLPVLATDIAIDGIPAMLTVATAASWTTTLRNGRSCRQARGAGPQRQVSAAASAFFARTYGRSRSCPSTTSSSVCGKVTLTDRVVPVG